MIKTFLFFTAIALIVLFAALFLLALAAAFVAWSPTPISEFFEMMGGTVGRLYLVTCICIGAARTWIEI